MIEHSLPRTGRILTRVLAAVALCTLLSAPQAQAPAARFRAQQDAATAPLAAAILTEAERAYVASLPVVRVAVPTPPAEPYELIDAQGVVSGIHPEMLLAIGRAFGIRMVPVVLPGWPAVLEAARQREVDIVTTIGVTAERSTYLEFTLGATPWPGALFARRGAAEVNPETARFVVEREYLAADHVRRQYPKATLMLVDSTVAALRAVAQGQADYYLGSLLEATASLAREPVPEVEARRPLNYGTGHYHFGVRKDWAPLAAILNKGIQTLRTGRNDPLDAALAALPPGLRPQPTLRLDAQESDVLVRHPVWRIGAVRGLAMLNDVDQQAVHSGIAAEYAEQVARRLGVGTIVIPFDNVAAMLDALRAGSIDLIPFLTRTPKRAREFRYSRPYVEMPYMIVARSDGPLYWNLGSLRGRRLALAHEHPLREVISARYPDIRVVDAPNGNAAMDMVAKGLADAAVEVKLFANVRINSDNDGLLRTTASVDELPAQFGFAASREAAALVPLVDRALADIPPSENERMLRRWVAVDLHPSFPWRRYAPLFTVAGAALLILAFATWWWMRRLASEVKVRRRSEQLLNDIATTVPGVAFRYVIDGDGTLRHHYYTPGAKTFLGLELDAGRTVVASLAPFLRSDQREAALVLEQACLRTGEHFELTTAFALPQARERWLHIEAVQTRANAERAVWTGYMVDVSSQHELQEHLVREAQARNLLLATASHELRAPTHNLSLALQSIDTESLDPGNANSVRIAKRSAQNLGQLINDVLDAAKFDSGTMRLAVRTFDLRELLQELHDVWHMAATERGLAFDMSLDPKLPRLVTLDPLRLKQVLTNLLSNACKYTTQGRFQLRVARGMHGLDFVVEDTGVGMTADMQQRLFHPFETADDAQAGAAAPSTGLGMLVSRKLVELMGGDITVRSEPGVGTVVSFHVPLPPEPAAREAAGGSIVVCDDDHTSLLLLGHMLRVRGFDVVEAGDAETALESVRRGGVRALVTDLTLPGMSGRELIQAVRMEQGGSPLTVVVCSGTLVTECPDDPQGAAYDAYLSKPVRVDALVGTLEQLGVSARSPAAAAADAVR